MPQSLIAYHRERKTGYVSAFRKRVSPAGGLLIGAAYPAIGLLYRLWTQTDRYIPQMAPMFPDIPKYSEAPPRFLSRAL